jgi:hypothetical protein
MGVNLISLPFFASGMSRTPSVLVTRASPNYLELVKLFKRERDGRRVRCLHVIILMLKFADAEEVAQMCVVSANTVRRWVEAFNEEGLDGLFKKNYPDGAPS